MPSRGRRARRQATVEGRRAVLEALRAGRPVRRILLSATVRPGPQVAEIVALAEASGVEVEAVGREALERASLTGHHQGVIALVPDPRYVDVEDLVARARASCAPALLVMLDGIEDPHNFGAIVRTVDAAGGHGVIIPSRRAASITPGAVRASAGALEHVPVARVV
ncbi:MAG: RNA methyltransferase, partial [Gemmatimonadetes bacterium]|nr:RNA methyltransferase [Gemmatimonadota bacterium]